MTTSTTETSAPRAISVKVTNDAVEVDLSDGRTVIAPLAWYPRLQHSTPKERNRWRLIGGGEGIHWPGVDEDISVEGLLAGRPSGESQQSFKRWLSKRSAGLAKKRLHLPKSPTSRVGRGSAGSRRLRR